MSNDKYLLFSSKQMNMKNGFALVLSSKSEIEKGSIIVIDLVKNNTVYYSFVGNVFHKFLDGKAIIVIRFTDMRRIYKIIEKYH